MDVIERENGIMEHRNTRRKKIYVAIAFLIILLIVSGVARYLVQKKIERVSFDENAKLYFYIFADTYNQNEYEFYSLDAYYLEDSNMYFYNGKFKGYTSIDDTWSDIDQVCYGENKYFDNMYCRSWDELYGFEDVDKEFERAMREGIHKSYTKEEIEKLLEEAYNNKE